MTQQDSEFLPVIWSLVQAHNSSVNDFSKRKLKEALKDVIKKWTDQPVSMVSKKVMELATENNKNPFDIMWPKRKIFGVDSDGKSLLLWEHTTPIGELYITLTECNTLDEVKSVMSNYSGVCWITRDEDNMLNSSGYRSKRPGGWLKCYEECGIEIIQK